MSAPGRGGPDIGAWAAMVARDLVDHADQVVTRVVDEDGAQVVELEVDPEEMGRVIGRQGRTVQAMRTLLNAAGDKHGATYDLEVLE